MEQLFGHDNDRSVWCGRLRRATDSQHSCLGSSLAYTARMKRIVVSTLWFSLILTTPSIARVKITVPARQYKLGEQILAKVENAGKYAVTICVEFGQTSMKDGEVESTPSPFWVQRDNNGK
jgi:hypothetical protein